MSGWIYVIDETVRFNSSRLLHWHLLDYIDNLALRSQRGLPEQRILSMGVMGVSTQSRTHMASIKMRPNWAAK